MYIGYYIFTGLSQDSDVPSFETILSSYYFIHYHYYRGFGKGMHKIEPVGELGAHAWIHRSFEPYCMGTSSPEFHVKEMWNS